MEDSNFREFEDLNRSFDSETAFLKKKLIETHNKLLRQLEINREMEGKMAALVARNDQLTRDNDSFNRRLSQLTLQDRTKEKDERLQTSEKRITELESKNELLRIDLESMRTRILSEMLEKSSLEENLNQKEEQMRTLQQRTKQQAADLKQKEVELIAADRAAISQKQKYDSCTEALRRLTTELEERKAAEERFASQIGDLELQIRQDRERYNSLSSDYKNKEKELHSLKAKLENSEELIADLRNKLYSESKERPAVNAHGMEKLTQEFNALSVRYRQLEKELAEVRALPQSENTRRRREFVESRDFVEKLEQEQKQRQSRTSYERSKSPLSINSKNHERKDYMERINELGALENTLLQCNIARNKALTEMDKIDGIKVKTNELITRRRKLEEQLKRTETIAEQTKRKLKDLNVI